MSILGFIAILTRKEKIMSNLLRRIEEIPDHPTSFIGLKATQLKSEIIDDIERLAEEMNYLKDKVKVLVSSPRDQDEMTDTLFKLRDLTVSMNSRKQNWESLISHADVGIKAEMDKVMAMLLSSAEKLEGILKEAL